MKRRIVRLGLVLACVFAPLAGCQSHKNLRPKPDDPVSDAPEEPKVDHVNSKPPKGFFQSSRLPGAMSDEGREIERSLGIQ